jgi:hypothetical protein
VTLAAMSQVIPNHVHGPDVLIVDGAGRVHDRRDVWFSRLCFHLRRASASVFGVASMLDDNRQQTVTSARNTHFPQQAISRVEGKVKTLLGWQVNLAPF